MLTSKVGQKLVLMLQAPSGTETRGGVTGKVIRDTRTSGLMHSIWTVGIRDVDHEFYWCALAIAYCINNRLRT